MTNGPAQTSRFVSPRVRRFIVEQEDGVRIRPPPTYVVTPLGKLRTIPWHLGDAGFADPKNFSTPPHIVAAIVEYLAQGIGTGRSDTLEDKRRVLEMVSKFRDGTLSISELFRRIAEFEITRNVGQRYSGAYYDVVLSDRFKELIANERKRDGSLCIDSKNDIVVTNSGSEAFDYLIKALIGYKVLMPKPNFFTYHVVSDFYASLQVGLTPLERQTVLYDCDEQGMPILGEIRRKIRQNPEIKAILVINPNNPTGAVYSREMLLGIVEIARENGLLIIADQVYNQLTLDMNRAVLMHELTTDVPIVEIMSFSKEYLMAGYRLGALLFYNANDLLLEVIKKLDEQRMASNIVSCAGGVAALEGSREHMGLMKAMFRVRREAFNGINEIPGLRFIPPTGAFYGRIIVEGMTGVELSRLLLEKGAIATIPGDAFALKRDRMGYSFVRVTLLTEEERITEGIERIARIEEFRKRHLG